MIRKTDLQDFDLIDLAQLLARVYYLRARQAWRRFCYVYAEGELARQPDKKRDLRPSPGCCILGAGVIVTLAWVYILARLFWPVIVWLLGVL